MKKFMIPFMIGLLAYSPTTRPQVTMLDLVAIWLTCTCVTHVVTTIWGKQRANEKAVLFQELKRQRHLLRQYCLLMQQNQCAFEKCSRQHATILKLAHQLGIDLEVDNERENTITRCESPEIEADAPVIA